MNNDLDNYSPITIRINTFGGKSYAVIPDGIDAKSIIKAYDRLDELMNNDARLVRLSDLGGCDPSRITKSGIVSIDTHKPQGPADLLPGEIWLKYNPQMKWFDMYVGCPFGYTSEYGENRISLLVNGKWKLDDNTLKMLNNYPTLKHNIQRLAEKYSNKITTPDVLK